MCSSETMKTSPPSSEGSPWSIPSDLRPPSQTAHFSDTEITVVTIRRAISNGSPIAGVFGSVASENWEIWSDDEVDENGFYQTQFAVPPGDYFGVTVKR